jgi:hypothetical protein
VIRVMMVLLLGSLLCLGQATKQPPRQNSRVPSLNEVLSWLPVDTETVLAANGPFPFPDFDSATDDDDIQVQLSLAELNLRMRALPLSLFGFGEGRLSKVLKGIQLALVVEGSRHFRSPTGLGSTLYEGCQIAVFEGAANIGDSLLRSVASSAKRVESVEGAKVAVFEETLENDVWTMFVAFPRNNIALIATDEKYLREVLSRMRKVGAPRALPESLAEWKYVNTHAPYWGLRHFEHREAAEDPTSPFLGSKAANVPDDEAVGVAFWVDPANRKRVILNYLSGNSQAREILVSRLAMADAETAAPQEYQIRLRRPASGVVEGSVVLSDRESFYKLLLGLSAMLGHALYL